MTLFQKIVTGALALLLIWAIAVTFFPFFVDGFFTQLSPLSPSIMSQKIVSTCPFSDGLGFR